MTKLFPDEPIPPGLAEVYERMARTDEDERETNHGRVKRRGERPIYGGLSLELAKMIIPALLAVGGAWLSMDHRMSALEGEVRALTVSVNEMKAMLGIGVYHGRP